MIRLGERDRRVEFLNADPATSLGLDRDHLTTAEQPWESPEIDGETWTCTWALDDAAGLYWRQLRFGPRDDANARHRVAETLCWRRAEIRFGPGQSAPVPLTRATCREVMDIRSRGTRYPDRKDIQATVGALFVSPPIPDPRDAAVQWTVEAVVSLVLGTPARDQEPFHVLKAVKAYPCLTATARASGPNPQPVDIVADLQMVFAPRLTSNSQRRPDRFYPSGHPRRDTTVASSFADNNDLPRVVPPLTWNLVFDYGAPDVDTDTTFEAVVWPRDVVSTATYNVNGPSLFISVDVRRVPGQGSYDNLHIHPWVGFDGPGDLLPGMTDYGIALCEAPLAADEVVHMHWRWTEGFPDGPFRGYAPDGTPNALRGAPLIPPNQSLTVRLTRPEVDGFDAPAPQPAPLDPSATAVWYRAAAHRLRAGQPAQFMTHGFGLGYELVAIPGISLTGAAADMFVLGEARVGTYHSFRWPPEPLRSAYIPDTRTGPSGLHWWEKRSPAVATNGLERDPAAPDGPRRTAVDMTIS